MKGIGPVKPVTSLQRGALMPRSSFVPLILAAATLTFPVISRAQFTSGIEGTVQDPVQAAVPGADVTVINEGTRVTLRAKSGENGLFRILQLPPGAYRVEVRHPGFQAWIQSGIALEGNELRTLYPALTVGEQ